MPDYTGSVTRIVEKSTTFRGFTINNALTCPDAGGINVVKQMRKQEVRVITGNAACAYGAMLCRPDVIASYPISLRLR